MNASEVAIAREIENRLHRRAMALQTALKLVAADSIACVDALKLVIGRVSACVDELDSLRHDLDALDDWLADQQADVEQRP